MTIREKQEEIIEEFSFFDDWADKYGHIIEYGRGLPPYPEEFRDEAHLVKGCVSQVWLYARLEGEQVVFDADSDALITKGLIALLQKVYSGHHPSEIITKKPHFIEQIGLGSHLSPNRANGLNSMMRQIQSYALGFQALLDRKAP